LIGRVCEEIKEILLQKNKAYGDSALNPVRIFSQADPIEQINVRIDDKLSRLARGSAAGEDTELDLIGYLILKRVARLRDEIKDPPPWGTPALQIDKDALARIQEDLALKPTHCVHPLGGYIPEEPTSPAMQAQHDFCREQSRKYGPQEVS
jgi:hypothetical protein